MLYYIILMKVITALLAYWWVQLWFPQKIVWLETGIIIPNIKNKGSNCCSFVFLAQHKKGNLPSLLFPGGWWILSGMTLSSYFYLS